MSRGKKRKRSGGEHFIREDQRRRQQDAADREQPHGQRLPITVAPWRIEVEVTDEEAVRRILDEFSFNYEASLQPGAGSSAILTIKGDKLPLTCRRDQLPGDAHGPDPATLAAGMDPEHLEKGLQGFSTLLSRLAAFLEGPRSVYIWGRGDGMIPVLEWSVAPGVQQVEFKVFESPTQQARDADTITWEEIERLCPDEAGAFLEVMDRHEFREEEFAQFYVPQGGVEWMIGEYVYYGPLGKLPEKEKLRRARQAVTELIDAWKALQTAFARATQVGSSSLTLGMGWTGSHEKDSEFQQVHFTVEGAYKLTPAGKQLKDKLHRVRGVWSNT